MDKNIKHVGKKTGVGRKLSVEQESEIFNLITFKAPYIFGHRTKHGNKRIRFWTRTLLLKLINDKFKEELTLTDGGIANYLNRWGMPSLNKDKTKSSHCDEAIQNWLNANLDNVLSRSKQERAKIYWIGKVSTLRLNPDAKDKAKKKTAITIISNQGKLHWFNVDGNYTYKKQLNFLNALIDQSKCKVFLILQNLTHYTDLNVIRWLEDNQKKIEVFPPPSIFLE